MNGRWIMADLISTYLNKSRSCASFWARFAMLGGGTDSMDGKPCGLPAVPYRLFKAHVKHGR